MSEKRIQFNNIVQNQLPAYTQGEFPLVSEFLKSYYQGQEYQGGPIDLIENIDDYVKVGNITNLTDNVGLRTDITLNDETIEVDMVNYPTGTEGFPKNYGLLKIDDEIITYTGITTTAFTGCVRGFCGITSYKAPTKPDVLVFNSSTSTGHLAGSKVQNLSSLFLKEFLLKTKHQILPGLENRNLHKDLNQNLFIKQSKDFYLSKGTDRSFEILFKALYDEDVKVIKPGDFLFTPSNANFKITNDIVVEPVDGDPTALENSTLFQGKYGDNIEKAYAPVGSVEPIRVGAGQTFYKISFDTGYDRDIRVKGAIYGDFVVHDKTKVIGSVSVGATTFDVDSTVGFPKSGELKVVFTDATDGIVSYTSRSVNQFFGCSGITGTIADAANIGINTYAYGSSNLDPDDQIRVNITSVLSELKYSENTHNFSVDETARIKTLGVSDNSFKGKNWFYNIAPTFEIKEIELIDPSDSTYQVVFQNEHSYKIGDSITLIDNAGNERPSSVILNIDDSTTITIKGQGVIDLTSKYTAKRNILKAVSNTFPSSNIYSTNVQNVYKYNDDYLVASSSIPTYNSQPLNVFNQSITFSGLYSGSEFEIVTSGDHGFYTGDSVYYSPQRVTEEFYDAANRLATREVIKTSLFISDLGIIGENEKAKNEGLYFVKRVNQLKVKLAKSRNDLENSKFIVVDSPLNVTDNKLEPYDFHAKTLKSQNIFREVKTPQNDGSINKTTPGFTGVLINGVEILNYKSKDTLHYGSLNNIEVISGGVGYDVINPPNLEIKDNVGTGATGSISVSGSVNEIRVIDPGFDYVEKPSVSISGGNGKGAVASVSTKLISHLVSFNSQSAVSVSLGTGYNVGFSTYHKFRNAEAITYRTAGQKSVGGISTDTTYFASVINPTTVRLHLLQRDAIAGINTIQLSSFGVGNQNFECVAKKSVVESVNILSSGTGYSNNKTTTDVSGINTASNNIHIANHGYNSGEVVKYSTTGTLVGGLSNNTEYYVTKIDSNNFKLSSVGTNVGEKDFFYNTKQYVDLTSVGLGTHNFNYPDISVSISGKIGISTIGFDGDTNTVFGAKIQPVVRGDIKAINLSDKGGNYGSSDIINFNREPDIILSAGKNAQLDPIVNNGQIVEVLVQNTGSGYNSPPDIDITGSGVGAVLTPILEDGKIVSVNVIEGGIGYIGASTKLNVILSGRGSKFRSIINSWKINLFERHFDTFEGDDGFIAHEFTPDMGLQYSHLYAPRKLRESVFCRDQSGRILYGKPDLQKVNGIEVPSIDHSPIIGWAYDGNPIYGPFGYITKQGGSVAQLKSGYSLELLPNRPPVSEYPLGFFVEDYKYTKVNDDVVLDENNGRFCVTPEFPEGTYAYFTTVDNGAADSAGVFNKYKRPVFPYLIGDGYQSIPNSFNFDINSNQNSYDLEGTNWSRNTQPYNLIETKEVRYKYAYIPDDLSQTIDVKAIAPGQVEKLGIQTSGELYQVGDTVVFDNLESTEKYVSGFGANVVVSDILGKQVTQVSGGVSAISGVEIYPAENNIKGNWDIISDGPHNFNNRDLIVISGLSTTSSQLEGSYNAGIGTDSFALAGIGTTTLAVRNTATTGLVTFFNISGDLNQIKSNDILGVGTERIKVLNVEPGFGRIRALRNVDGTVGTLHTVTSIVSKVPRVLTIDAGIKTTFNAKRNKEIYFNPIETVAQGVGIGSTLFVTKPGIGVTSFFIPTKSIFLKNHGLETGDELTYSNNGGTSLKYDTGSTTFDLLNNQTVFAAKITNDLIGIGTVRVGLGSTGTFVGIETTASTVAFAGIGTGVYHSFKTNYKPITGTITRNQITVSTGSSHGLITNDFVDIGVNPSVGSTFTVAYNDYNRRLVINSVDVLAADINVTDNSIKIENHGYSTGQKVICTASTPPSGITNNGIYYVVVLDLDNVKLSNSHYDSTLLKPVIVDIQNQSNLTINPINPAVDVYKDSLVEFDLSDSTLGYVNQGTSYPAFEFNFYKDQNFTQLFDKTESSKVFEVNQTGVIGVSADAKVTLRVNDTIPSILYYRLDPIFETDLPIAKEQTIVDFENIGSNEVQVKGSLYNGKQQIVVGVGSTSTFTYTVAKFPERVSYSSASSVLKYTTSSKSAYGSIEKFEVKDGGRNYFTLPGISTITTSLGRNAIVSVASTSIGVIKKTKIQNIGFNFPSDPTLRPSVGLPQIIDMKSLASLKSVGIASVGKGYATAPKLLVFDGETGVQVKDVDLKYTLGESQVKILKNTKGISKVTPSIIPVENSNGVGISTVGFNTVTKDVTLTLSVGFSTANSFPFTIGDKILIENISVGVGTTARGYNSAEYGYKLFTVNGLDPNLGGIGTVGYSIADDLIGAEYPGSFSPNNSAAARIIPEKYFPAFSVELTNNNFFIGETVKSGLAEGLVETWDRNNEVLVISSKDVFKVDDVIEGQSSLTKGVATKVSEYDATLKTGPFSKVENGWETESGFFNENQQRVQDNDYYQNFSYSLKSKVSYDNWNDVVSSLNHTLGYKKFSDYQLESSMGNSMVVGITTDVTYTDVVNDIVGEVDLNCVTDFDLVKENSLTIPSGTLSDEIIFSSRILTDYEESFGNRVLSIDDMSGSFNSNPRSTPFSVVERFNLSEHRAQKYITYVKDKRFYSERQLMIVDLIHDGSFGYIQQYGRIESVYDMGSFDFSILGSEGQLLFYPNKSKVNDYDIVALSYNLDDNILGVGTTSIGTTLIDSHSVSVPKASASTTIVSIANTYQSAKIILEVTADSENVGNYDEFEFEELNMVHDGTNVELLDYAEMTTTLNNANVAGFGTYSAAINGSKVEIDFHPNTGIGTTAVVNALVIANSNQSTTSQSSIDLKHARLESRSTNIAASGSPTAHVVGSYPDAYDAAYFTLQVSDTTNSEYGIAELVVIDDYDELDGTGETFTTNEYAVVTSTGGLSITGLGTFHTGISTDNGVNSGGAVGMAATTQLIFTPLPNVATNVKVFMNALRHQDDAKDSIEFNNSSIQVAFSGYTGTDRDIKRSFNLTHQQSPIFEKSFDGSSVGIVSVASNTIELPNHFFVSGEKIKYVHAGAGTTQAVSIASTDGFVGVGTTNKLPSDLFVIKIDDNKIKIADTAQKALLSVPESVDLTSVGIGTSHRFVSTNANAKALLCLDNIIQSPVVATAITSSLSDQVFTTDDLINLTGITSFFGGDLIRVGSEIMKIEGIGIGDTNRIRVRREWLGTSLAGHSTSSLVTKVNGNYNIVENVLNFVEAPFGNLPLSTSTNPPDSRDWTGISTSSSFQGRSFMRSGIQNTSNDTYYKNYIFDDISEQFNGIKDDFILKTGGANVTGIEDENAVVLVNDVFQSPNLNYSLGQASGITTITFTGTASSTTDANVSTLPMGGVILSVGSTEGTGYQPLVAAGGTAVVSAGGTISSVSIGNSGSGYRSGVQTVNVSVQEENVVDTTITKIGTASISDGHITGIAVTNWTSFYKPRDIQNVTYNNTTGITTITTATPHGLATGDDINISGIAFTCTYSSADERDIQTLTYNNVNGTMTVTTATPHGLSVGKDVILTGIAMTCGLDAGIGTHYYPRNRDRVYDTAIPITETTATTISVNVTAAKGLDQYTHQFVSASTNAVITGGNYGHAFVGANPSAVSVTGWTTSFTPTGSVYNPTTGDLELTIANHGLSNSNTISVSEGGLTFTCDMDAHSTYHPYPRSTDPIAGIATAVNVINANTITINVGTSPLVNFNVSAASYNASTGKLDLTIGAHGLTSGTSIKLAKESLVFKCSKDNYASEHKYPRSGDPSYNGVKVIGVNSPTKFDVNVGVSTVPTFYKSGGKVQGVIIAPRAKNNSPSGTDVAANGTTVLNIIDNSTFTINSGVSTTPHFYARGGTVEKPLDVIIDDPLSYTNIPLVYSSDSVSGFGSDATVDIVVGQGASVTDFSIQNTGYGYGVGEILTVEVGGATGIPTTGTYREFQLTIDDIFSDEFNAWSVGILEALDSPQELFDGETVGFQLKRSSEIISIRSAAGSKINVEDVILIFLNDILQIPGKAYTFAGGSIITFTEAPKSGDTCKIIFYKGSGAVDVKSRSIIETVKKGDDLTIDYDPSIGQKPYQQEDERSVLRVDSTDIVTTNPYFGPGNTSDVTLMRPVTWCRQTEDKIINDVGIGKDRELYEPNINPVAYITKSVGVGSTAIYVDSVRPFFDPRNENANATIRATVQDSITIIDQNSKVGSILSASITGGSVDSIAISNGGSGYVTTPSVSIQTPVGLGSTAIATASITAGVVTSVTVSSGGTGYASAPQVLIDPPTLISEVNAVSSYVGDSGIIVGFGTTTISSNPHFMFDLFVPLDSYVRDTDLVGSAVTVSGLNTNDIFIVSDSNVGLAQTSITSLDSAASVVGVGKSYVDNVYEVTTAQTVYINVTGVGFTHVRRIFTRVSDQMSDFPWGVGIVSSINNGDYSWGKISISGRSATNSYAAYTLNGISGISTSTRVQRTFSLKSKNYSS